MDRGVTCIVVVVLTVHAYIIDTCIAGAKKKAKGNDGDGPYIGMAAHGKWTDEWSKNYETIKLQISY